MSRRRSIADGARAYVYARISLARDDLATRRQIESCRKLCAARGWTVVGLYVDESISAYTGKHRPEFERMLDDARAGGCDVIVAWDIDRLVRRVAEVTRLLDLYRNDAVPFVTVEGGVDMTSAAGKLIATILTAVAEMESEHKAERLRLRYEQDREAGRPHWTHRPFGFELTGEHRPAEAAAVVEVYRRFIEGDSRASIVEWLNGSGLVHPRGKPWTLNTFAHLITAARNAGRRDGLDKDAPVAWEPIVDAATFDTAQRVARTRADASSRPAQGEYLLSGVAFCALCGERIYVSRPGVYGCVNYPKHGRHGCGKIRATAGKVDEVVAARVLDIIADPANRRRILASQGNGDAAALLAELAEATEAKQRILDLVEKEHLFERSEVRGKVEALNARIAAARTRLASVRTGVLELPDAETLREQWPTLAIEHRRALLAEVVESVRIHPHPKPGARFDPARVEVVERYPAPAAKRTKRTKRGAA